MSKKGAEATTEEPTDDEQAAKLSTILAASTIFTVCILCICAAILPWWKGSSAGSRFARASEIRLNTALTLWEVSLTLQVPISPDSPDLHTITRSFAWNDECDKCDFMVPLQAARAFTILTVILALGATGSFSAAFTEPLGILAGALLSFVCILTCLVAVICALVIESGGLIGEGFILLLVATVLSVVSMALALYAASKALADETAAHRVAQSKEGSRLKRSKFARDKERTRSQELEEQIRRSRGDGDFDIKKFKSYTHLKRVIEWSAANSAEEIPIELLEASYREVDDSMEGSISIDDVLVALRASGMQVTKNTVLVIWGKDSTHMTIQGFVEFFRSVEELSRFQHRAEQRTQIVALACSCCFIIFIVVVGTLLLFYIQVEEGDDKVVLQNALIACSVVLGFLFIMVILVPALKFTLGTSAASWHLHCKKRFKPPKRRPGGSNSGFAQQTGDRSPPKSGLRQASWGTGEVATPAVNAAMFGASYRVKKAQAEMARLNRDWHDCPNGCGFQGTKQELTQHEYMCPLRGRHVTIKAPMAAGDEENGPPPPGVILNEDGEMDRYDPMAFQLEHMNQMSQQSRTFLAVTGVDTSQLTPTAPERAAANSGGFMALTNGPAQKAAQGAEGQGAALSRAAEGWNAPANARAMALDAAGGPTEAEPKAPAAAVHPSCPIPAT